MGDISDFDDVRTTTDPNPSGSSSPKKSDVIDDDDDETPADRILRGLPGSSSDEGSDSDNETGGRPVRKMRRSQAPPQDWVSLPILLTYLCITLIGDLRCNERFIDWMDLNLSITPAIKQAFTHFILILISKILKSFLLVSRVCCNLQGNSSNCGGDAFRAMASQFQQNRASQSTSPFSASHHQLQLRAKKANNVWGAVLTEETLTSDMIGVGVGKRSLKELVNRMAI
jgi:hypothetical protein